MFINNNTNNNDYDALDNRKFTARDRLLQSRYSFLLLPLLTFGTVGMFLISSCIITSTNYNFYVLLSDSIRLESI